MGYTREQKDAMIAKMDNEIGFMRFMVIGVGIFVLFFLFDLLIKVLRG